MAESSYLKVNQLAPFRIDPIFTERVWGFADLHPWYDRVAEGNPIGEVWLTGDESKVATGPHAGKKLGQLFAEEHAALLGPDAPGKTSPLLIKVIFAREKLSVQVHPDDAMAKKYGQPRGKTECWYALSAGAGAEVAVGFKPGTTLEQVRNEIHDGTLESSLNAVHVDTGDMIYVDAGTVHAIWPGAILLETQQYSDTTYRMFDYGRPRELHVEKSLEALKFETHAGKIKPRQLADRVVLIDVDYFRIERVPVFSIRTSENLRWTSERRSLEFFFAAAGSARITGDGFGSIRMPPCSIVCVPASSPDFVLEDEGDLDLIRIAPNWPEFEANLA
ncbi:MAG TPA: type I phosphomannose isomerase catalytic subunit [Terracidiphilus sp.]|nr:type I phosphomannose isomerase catalytic subunit [Terracidiphilus sp.]